jgi:hypothetical protein
MTMTLIETKTLGSDTASIEFASIPQDATDLLAFFSIRSSRAGQQADSGFARFNSNSSSYSGRELFGDGSNRYGGTTNTTGIAFVVSGAAPTANTFSNGSLYVPNYTGSTNKSATLDWVTENNATTAYAGITSYLWSNTAAITTLTFSAANGNLIAGSTVSLYKILKGTLAGVVVS